MALNIMQTIKPVGTFPAVDAEDVLMPDGTRLSDKDLSAGRDGTDGLTPYIGDNGNWWIGEEDTGVAAQGEDGEKGDKGEKGDPGESGSDYVLTDADKEDIAGQLSGNYLPLSGGELTGELLVKNSVSIGKDDSEENINLVNESPDDATPVLSFFGSQSDDPVRLYNIANPVEASDAATKEYVDNHSASVAVDSELSITSENPVQNKVVTTNFNGAMQTLQNNVLPNLLPAVTSADNGKVLAAVGGKWTPVAVAVPDDTHINALIDAKLGVIENGSY